MTRRLSAVVAAGVLVGAVVAAVLHVTGLLLPGTVELIPQSNDLFTTTEGVSYKFVKDDSGAVIRAEEIHRGGNYVLNRKN